LNIEKENVIGEMVIHDACLSGNVSLIKYLIEHGLNIHKKNNRGETLLARYTFYCNDLNKNVIKNLIENGYDVCYGGNTILVKF